MKSKSNQIYTIKLSDWIFHDPKFSKKTSSYVAISRAFLNSKKTELLSLGEFKLMISLIEEAQNLSESTLEVDEKFLRSQGKAIEKSLLKLSNYGYLDYTVSKLVSKLSSKGKAPTNDNLKKEERSNYKHYFEKFIWEDFGTGDFNLANLSPKVDKAFKNEEGFNEFVSAVVSAKKYKDLEAKSEKQRYFMAALKSEMKDRGVL